jgi:hypothetical protein
MLRKFICALIMMLYFTGLAHAAPYDVPNTNPVFTLSVPDPWNPNHSDNGIDGSSPDYTLFFFISVMDAKDADAVQADGIAMLTHNGMTIDAKSAKPGTTSHAGQSFTEVTYAAKEDAGPRTVRISAAPLGSGRFIQLVVWGTGFAKHDPALKNILETIYLIKK